MPYTVLSADELINRVSVIIKKYTERAEQEKKTNRVHELHALSMLEMFTTSLKHLDRQQYPLTDDAFKELCVAAWVFSISYNLDKKSWYQDNLLNELLSVEPGIKELINLDAYDKLICLNKLYQAVKDHPEVIANQLTYLPKDLDSCKELLSVMSFLLQQEDNKNKFLLKAVPSLDVLKNNMQQVGRKYQKYLEKKEKTEYIHGTHDPHHKELADLITAFGHLKLPDNNTSLARVQSEQFLSRSERIYWGLILYSMQYIYNKYRVRSQFNAKLYRLCYKLFNQNDLNCFDAQTIRACIAAFVNSLEEEKIKQLEELMPSLYLDPIILRIKEEAYNIVKYLGQPKPIVTASAVTLTMAALGGILASAPGYGVGYTIGYLASEMSGTVGAKVFVSQLTGKVMTGIFGSSGQCLGFFVSNMVIDVALERSFAKIFELLAILLGAGTGAVIGIIVKDVSYETLRDLCMLCTSLQAKLHPNLARNIDKRVLDCLLSLPEEVFESAQKDKLRAITGQGIFQEIRNIEDAPRNTAVTTTSSAPVMTTTQSLFSNNDILIPVDDEENEENCVATTGNVITLV